MVGWHLTYLALAVTLESNHKSIFQMTTGLANEFIRYQQDKGGEQKWNLCHLCSDLESLDREES